MSGYNTDTQLCLDYTIQIHRSVWILYRYAVMSGYQRYTVMSGYHRYTVMSGYFRYAFMSE
jgi:hypothetical protein